MEKTSSEHVKIREQLRSAVSEKKRIEIQNSQIESELELANKNEEKIRAEFNEYMRLQKIEKNSLQIEFNDEILKVEQLTTELKQTNG